MKISMVDKEPERERISDESNDRYARKRVRTNYWKALLSHTFKLNADEKNDGKEGGRIRSLIVHPLWSFFKKKNNTSKHNVL